MNHERTHIDLFAGLGGFSLAAQANGVRTIVQCESEAFLRTGLAKAWGVPIVPDVREFNGQQWRGAWLLTAGTPCQPASRAGKQRGAADDRWLWDEALRVHSEAQPTWALYENPPGIDDVGLGGIIAEVEGIGYEVGLCRIPACAVNSPQDRDRFWIVAYRAESGREGRDAAGTLGRHERTAQQPESGAVADGNGSSWTGGPQRSETGRKIADGVKGGTVGNGSSPERWPNAESRGCGEQGQHRQGQATGGSSQSTQVCAVADSDPERRVAGILQRRQRLLPSITAAWSDFFWVPMPARDGTIEIRRAPAQLYVLADGVQRRIPSKFRSKLIAALSNAIVWPIAAEIIRALIAAEETTPPPA